MWFYDIINFCLYAVTKKYNFINIVKKCRNFFDQFFLDFAQIFDKSKLLSVRLHPPLLHHWIRVSFKYFKIESS